jgi:ABC-type lipoprotein release transport system permease subunit
MVGLSFIVCIVAVNESVTKGWQFPKKFPEAYIWNPEFIRKSDAREQLAETPGVKNFATTAIANVIVDEEPSAFSQFLASQKLLVSFTWFMGCEPDEFFDLVKLEFIEGDPETAKELLKKGGHLLVADDFSRSRNKHLGDEVKIWYGSQPMKQFKVAGVILSPALDIAAGYFQAHTEYNVVASGSVLGTNDDLRRHFKIDGISAILLNFDLPPLPVPEGWPPQRGSEEAKAVRIGEEFYDTKLTLERRWQKFREEQVLAEIRNRLEVPNANGGTVRALKDEIDREITKMTRLVTAVPTVALLVAAIGVANLMMANVTSRARQLAILRAVGATRGLVLRMVIGEAVVLGALGSALGLALGMHFAANVTELINRMWGFRVDLQLPWLLIGGAILMTVGLCILAGILPARHASRTNIVDALHVA